MHGITSRIKRLQAAKEQADTTRTVFLLPDNGRSDESPSEIQARWDKYIRTGKSDRAIVVVPRGVEFPAHG